MTARIRALFRNLFRRNRVERGLDEELNVCVEILTDEKIAQGMEPTEARRRARIEIGGIDQIKEQVREVFMGAGLHGVWQDLRYAVRVLLKNRGFTTMAILSLAVGIGANAALFTAINGVLLRTVSVPDADSLVRLKWYGPNDMVNDSSEYGYSKPYAGQEVRATFSYEVFRRLRVGNQMMTDLFTCGPLGPFNVMVNDASEITSAFGVSGNYFEVLRVPALFGRTISEDDDKPGAPPVALISHAYWLRRFGADPAVVGKSMRMSGNPVTIVGVTPPDFLGVRVEGAAPDITVPVSLDSQLNPRETRMSQPTTWWLQIMGRLKPGTTYEQVHGNLEGVFQQAAREGMNSYMTALTPEERSLSRNQGERKNMPHLLVTSARHGVYDVSETTTRSASLLGIVVVLVLLIVCANVANLTLSRAATRGREISVRLSMGATRSRLIRQLLTESLLLSGIGGVLGILVGYWGRQLVPFGQTAPVDWRVLAFISSLSVLTGVLFGLAPAFRATRMDIAGSLREQRRSMIGSRALLSRGLLVVQVAVSVVLLIAAGLFLRTLENLRRIDVGFNPNNVLMFTVSPRLNGYSPERTTLLYKQIQEATGALPGVRSVSLTQIPLLAGSSSSSTLYIQGRLLRPGAGIVEEKDDAVRKMLVSPEFFNTMEIPLKSGRIFTDRDGLNSPKVAVINETGARTYFSGENPLGKRVGFSIEESGQIEIVGVIRDTKYAAIRDEAPPMLYQSLLQSEAPPPMNFLVRTATDPIWMAESIRAAVRQVDSALPIQKITTQMTHLETSIQQERLFAVAYSLFGAIVLVLACIGLFGLMSYTVAQRTNEIGIRMALGAQQSDVIRMVLGESSLLVGIGIVIGIAAALAAGRLITSILYGLTTTDALTLFSAIGLMTVVATLAGYLPAWRASRVNPLTALHHE